MWSVELSRLMLRPNKKIKCVSGNRSEKVRYIFFMEKKYMHFDRHFAFQNA